MKLATLTKIAKIAIDLPISPNSNIEEYFYYSIPNELDKEIKIGTIVHIPFGKQEIKGFVIDITSSEKISDKEITLKPVYEVIYKESIWDKNYFELAKWISTYYHTNIGTVLEASINSDILDKYTQEVKLLKEINDLPLLTSEEQFIVNKLLKSKKKAATYRFLSQNSKFNKQKLYQTINQLKNKGIITTYIKEQKAGNRSKNVIASSFPLLAMTSSIQPSPLILNKEQQYAYNTILNSIKFNNPKTFLLHGVTGSGKTEVYLRLIEEVIKLNKTVIYLVPEIYLIPQTLERLNKTFNPSEIILWHSSLSKNERLDNFSNLINKKVKIIVGARSAVLAPLQNIGLIVIDEAHDSSYKQASPAPRYNAIKTAIKRTEIESCPIVLGTATPNITDYHFCLQQNTIIELSKRIEEVPMPKVKLIDLKENTSKLNKNIISNELKINIEKALNKNEQIILLLNRRGYSSHIFCRVCGFTQFCKNCSVPLVFHKSLGCMVCHHCGYKVQAEDNTKCPNCKSPHFKYFGLGTQQLEEEVRNIFTKAKVLRVDSDQLRKKDEYLNLWQQFASHKADILIGTQLVAKGIDLPNVTVVGVILADSMLNFPDYVSYERAFQLLTQITGRTGRGQKLGEVFIQSYKTDNPIYKFIIEHDYKAFFNSEIHQREKYCYPPFTTLTRLIFQSYDEKECINYANETLKILLGADQCVCPNEQLGKPLQAIFLGPAPCFFSKLHGKYRYHILCKINNEENNNQLISSLFKILKRNVKVDIIVDIDSVNLL